MTKIPTSSEPSIVASNGEAPDMLPGGLTSSGFYQSKFRVDNPPKDKRLACISDRAMRSGTYHGWAVYTPEMYEADKAAYGTNIPSGPDLSNGRVQVASHWYVFVPAEVAIRMDQARASRLKKVENEQSRPVLLETRHKDTLKVETELRKEKSTEAL